MNRAAQNRKVVWKSAIAVVAMFGFGFALVPLYDVFCEWTGINGKTQGRYTEDVSQLSVDESRSIRVQFVTQTNEGMPWEFRPTVSEVRVHPGQMMRVDFFARNPTDHLMTAQAVPSLSPSQGTDYFHKTECFCFNQQVLASKEEVLMPLVFVVDKALPKELKVLTLSYTLFEQASVATEVALR